jgi:protein gp37
MSNKLISERESPLLEVIDKGTDISWCHYSHNPWRGCTGERCVLAKSGLCYADNMETARGRDFQQVIPTTAQYWLRPWKWDAEAKRAGQAKRVFCGSLMDFNDRQADDWRKQVWPIIKYTPNLVWLLLTKIPERFKETLPADWGDGYRNVWLGATALHAEDFQRQTKHLRSVNAARRFLSLEPLFGAILKPDLTGIDLALVGGLSGPKWKSKVMDMQWAVDLYHAAKSQGTAYFFKQISARQDEQGIDALGLALDGNARVIQEIPDYVYPWAPMREKGQRLK